MKRLLVLLALPLLGASSANLVPLGPLRETFEPHPEIKGTDLVGLLMASPTTGLNLEDYAVVLPHGSRGVLCASLITRDAHYSGTRGYRIVSDQPARTNLVVGSQKTDKLKPYRSDDLAVKLNVRARGCDDEPYETFLPAIRASQTSSRELLALIRTGFPAFRAQAQLALADEKPKTPFIECDRAAGSAFDHVCKIPVDPALSGKTATLYIVKESRSHTPIPQDPPFRVSIP